MRISDHNLWMLKTAFLYALVVSIPLGLYAAINSMNLDTTDAPKTLVRNPQNLNAGIRGMVGQYTPPYQVDEATVGTIYIRYSSDNSTAVHISRSVEASSVTTYTKTYDAWTNRAAATYTPIND